MNQQQYLGRSVASWDLDLEPLPRHFDRRITVTTPLQKAGAYLLTARMEGGNTSRIVVWLDDTVIIKKPLAGKAYYFIADARTGQPVPRADVELFGWRMVQVDGRNEFRVETKTLALKADDDGQVQVPTAELNDPRDHSSGSSPPARPRAAWRTWASRTSGAPAGMTPPMTQVKVYAITDRPVYRPGAPVRFKFWVARSRYDQPDASDFAGQTFTVEIHNPKGEKVFTKSFKADAFGGFDGSFELPSDATLGVYQVFIPNRGGGSFRVEEYKKPEFEVNVEAPKTPVMLGEKISATIKAKYYFGGPVAEAKVKYKVTRTTADARWYPAARWDWLFGPGYWWFAADSSWYPGWSRWGMLRPVASWWWGIPRRLPKSWPRPRCRSGPTARSPSRSTPRSPRRPIPTRTSATKSPPRSPTSRAGRSSGRAPCWSPASRSASTPGSIAAITARATRSRRGSARRPSTASRSPARGRSSCSRSPTTPSASRSRHPSRAGT